MTLGQQPSLAISLPSTQMVRVSIPGGGGSHSPDTYWGKVFIRSAQMGRAAVAPVALIESLLSNPTQTRATRFGVYPTNQASWESLVVPVFPATGQVTPICFNDLAVPSRTTSRI